MNRIRHMGWRMALLGALSIALPGCPQSEAKRGSFQRIVLNPRASEVRQGSTLLLRAQSVDGYQYELEDTYTFSSKNPNIVSVTESGLATGVANGAATIEVKSAKYGKTASMVLNCSPTRGVFDSQIRVLRTEVDQDSAVPVEVTLGGNAAVLAAPVVDEAPVGVSLEGFVPLAQGKQVGALKTSIRTPPGTHRVRLALLDRAQGRTGATTELDLVVRAPRPATFAWKKVLVAPFGDAPGAGFGLTVDGRVLDWGTILQAPVPSTLVQDLEDVAIGGGAGVAIHKDGSLAAWGKLNETPVPSGARFKAVSVSAANGKAFALALSEDGKVFSFGSDNGLGAAQVPTGLPKIQSIAAGLNFSLALSEDGAVKAWGRAPAQATTLTDIAQISSFGSAAIALRRNGSAVLLRQDGTLLDVPDVTDIKAVSMGGDTALLLRNDGSVVGVNPNDGTKRTDVPALVGATAVHAGGSVHSAVASDGQLVTWGDKTSAAGVVPRSGTGIASVSSRLYSKSLWVVHTDGTVAGFGPDHNLKDLDPPAGLRDVKQVVAVEGAAVALKSDGTLVGWGTGPIAAVPRGLPPVQAIVYGGPGVVALLQDTSVFSWPSGFPLPAGPTGAVTLVGSPSRLYGLDASGKLFSISDLNQNEPDVFGTNTGISNASFCAGAALSDGKFVQTVRLQPPAQHHLRDLGCSPRPDNMDAVWGLSIRGDTRPLIWTPGVSKDVVKPQIDMNPGAFAEPMFALEGLTRISGDAFIRGEGDRAVAYIPTMVFR
jgi:alpha-tubulin suppressor-like RCC1 family protein